MDVLRFRQLEWYRVLQRKKQEWEDESHPMIEVCLCVVAISLSLVMAGTGDLSVFRVLRKLRRRFGSEYTYGNYMVIHMAIGFLFLGGGKRLVAKLIHMNMVDLGIWLTRFLRQIGRYTLSTSNTAIASLVCSVYPIFPASPNDNRYHLQAFRYF